MQLFKKKEGKKEEKVPEPKKEEVEFKISTQEKIPTLPEIKDKTKVDFRYPLIVPYAYVHIYWDEAHGELIYQVEEPNLDDKEKETLSVLEQGIREFINMSFISVTEKETLIEYLQKNVRVLLKELGIKLDKNSYLKIMYYIYRDFIGLNRIEPLMNDYYIEDIECNGRNTPVYLVHRKFQNLRTNIIYEDFDELKDFVAKLAQKCGRYISYGSPMVDGQLPDGSRVNATYTEDVTSRGPTFTLRKFTSVPWSPIKLIDVETVTPELLAYLWLLIEHSNNLLIVGATGSGKTSLLNSIAFFIPDQARIVSIEDSVTGDSKIIIKEKEKIRNISIKEFVENKIDAEVLSLDDNGKIIFVKPSKYIKHNVKKDIYEIRTSTGRRITVTKDHSLFSSDNGRLKEVKPFDLQQTKSFIAVPRILPIDGNEIKEINLMEYLLVFKNDFLKGEALKKLFEKYSHSELNVKKMRYKWWKKHNIIKIEEFMKLKYDFSYNDLKTLRIKSKNCSSIPIIFNISREFLEFCGLWLGDGSYDNHNKNAVIISNVDEECRELIKKIARYLQANLSVMNDKGVSLRVHSTIFYKFMKYILCFDGYSNTKKIPDFIFNLSNWQIKHFIRGYFSADGCIKKFEVSCSSQSYGLLQDLQSMFLRLGIIARINDFHRKDKCISMSISSSENLLKFKEIGFLQARKSLKLDLFDKKAHHTVSDIIPLSKSEMMELDNLIAIKLSSSYLNGTSNIGREYLQRIAPSGSKFNDISHNDVLWDKVKSVQRVSSDDVEVFDLSIPKYEKFLCNNIFVHNTRELNLVHENWLPAVARTGVGLVGEGGVKAGEVTMFDLLKESFRQRPDYVIVGEVRGQEANVLFQGAAAGHPSISTIHAEDVATVIRRLMTPPINLSPALIESLDAAILIGHATINGRDIRKVKAIEEIIKIGNDGRAEINVPFKWDPRTNKLFYTGRSYVFEKIIKKKGISGEELLREFKLRSKLLLKLYIEGISEFSEVQKIIHAYYKTPYKVLLRFGLIQGEEAIEI